MPTDLSIIIKVEKLLAQAADPGCTEAEREAFQEGAMRLIHRHRISEAELGGHLAADDVLGDYPFGRIPGGAYSRVKVQVIDAVAHGLDCRTYWNSYGNGSKRVMLYGFKSDADLAIPLAQRLLVDCETQAMALTSYSPTATLSLRRGFYLGYAYEIRSRLAAASQAARADAATDGVDVTSTDLVLVDRRAQVHDGYAARRIRTANPISAASTSGRQAGREAGARADLSHTNGLASGRKALSA